MSVVSNTQVPCDALQVAGSFCFSLLPTNASRARSAPFAAPRSGSLYGAGHPDGARGTVAGGYTEARGALPLTRLPSQRRFFSTPFIQHHRLPVLHNSMMGLEISMGLDSTITFDDYLNGAWQALSATGDPPRSHPTPTPLLTLARHPF